MSTNITIELKEVKRRNKTLTLVTHISCEKKYAWNERYVKVDPSTMWKSIKCFMSQRTKQQSVHIQQVNNDNNNDEHNSN